MSGKPVARVGDTGNHGGTIIDGSSSIRVNDRPIALVGSTYNCPIHGANAILTGAQSIFGNDFLVAHVGSKTACGAVIISGSPDVFIGDGNNTLFFSEKDSEYIYRINENYKISKAANILIEGSGIIHPAASFSIEGSIKIDDKNNRKLYATATGDTAIRQLANSITFYAEAILLKNDAFIDKKIFSQSPYGYIIENSDVKRFIIGEVEFLLPKPVDTTPLIIKIEGAYSASFNEGNVVPVHMVFRTPVKACGEFIIDVIKK